MRTIMNLPPIPPSGPLTLPAIPTEWFPITTDPVWPGMYDVTFIENGIVARLQWDGNHWLLPDGGIVDTIMGTEKWRGVRL